MSYYLFMTAAAICFLSVGVHGIWGRRIYLRLIAQTNLPAREKSISAVSWDVFSIMLLVSGLSLVYVALNPQDIAMAYPIIVIHLMGAGRFLYADGARPQRTCRLARRLSDGVYRPVDPLGYLMDLWLLF
jgi:hypothetical protein